MNRVVVIGAGFGGLAAALRLRHAGFEVTILEKLPRVGGRSQAFQENGYRLDTGPTILVMKSVLEETYQSLGKHLDQRVKLVQLDPNYRIFYHDGTFFDLHANMAQLAAEAERIKKGAAEQVFRFLGDSAKKYALGMEFVERNYDHLTDLANPRALSRLLSTRAYANLYHQVDDFFGDDKLNKAFSFHAMFLGLSPFEAPAMYSLITYADLALGMWYPLGGIYSLVEDLKALAEEMGIEIRTASPVRQILISQGRVTGVRLDNGTVIPADLVVSNADLPYTYRNLIAPDWRPHYPNRRIDSWRYACSGYLLYLAVDGVYPHLHHQSLYFSTDYRANLDSIFRSKTLPEEPSFHLNVPTTTDPGLAPEGHSLLYVLAPMPNLSARIDWSEASRHVREKLITKLEQLIDPQIRKHIIWEKEYCPSDFKQDFNAILGTAFGSLSHDFFQSAYFRPHNVDRKVKGLYFVGQGTYPGIGVPMVLISAKLVAERIIQEWN